MSLPLLRLSRIQKNLVRPAQTVEPGLATQSDTLGQAERRDAVLSWLGEGDQEIPEQDIASILDAFRHDHKIHRTLIARRHLPATIVDRLVRLVASQDDVNDLLRRHGAPGSPPVDVRSVRSRPGWWR